MATEKRLIDAEALKKAVRMWPRTKQPVLFYIGTVLKGIEEAPTVDAVEVVRCKDCIHRHTRYNCQGRRMDFFCANGERVGGRENG